MTYDEAMSAATIEVVEVTTARGATKVHDPACRITRRRDVTVAQPTTRVAGDVRCGWTDGSAVCDCAASLAYRAAMRLLN